MSPFFELYCTCTCTVSDCTAIIIERTATAIVTFCNIMTILFLLLRPRPAVKKAQIDMISHERHYVFGSDNFYVQLTKEKSRA